MKRKIIVIICLLITLTLCDSITGVWHPVNVMASDTSSDAGDAEDTSETSADPDDTNSPVSMIAKWYIFIYDTLYVGVADFTEYNKITQTYEAVKDLFEKGAGAAVSTLITTLGMSLVFIYFFINLTNEVIEQHLAGDAFFKMLVILIFSIFLVQNAQKICGLIFTALDEIGKNLMENKAFKDLKQIDLAKFTKATTGFGLVESAGMILKAFIPYLLCIASNIILIFIGLTRIMELSIRTLFSPIAVADIYRNGMSSPGAKYLKKIAALGMQMLMIIGISVVIAFMMSSNKMFEATTATHLLNDVLGEAGKYSYDAEKCRDFIKMLLAGEFIPRAALIVVKIGLTIKSMDFCNEVMGV